VVVPDAAALHKQAEAHRINLRKIDAQHVGISLDECATEAEIEALIQVFNAAHAGSGKKLSTVVPTPIPSGYARTSGFLKHAVFNRHRSETDMLRYLRKLESRDISLCHSMIPLGSCSMKLNATAEMFPVSWPEIGKLHPFAPWQQTLGYQQIFEELESWLAVCTGFAGVSLQPNAGSQGEYAGLLIIRAYHEAQGQSQRNICLIPTSAHGTNPASAVMAGLTVVAVACDKDGNIDVADLKAKAEANKENLSALMTLTSRPKPRRTRRTYRR
jgi:glycine dehydrogenase